MGRTLTGQTIGDIAFGYVKLKVETMSGRPRYGSAATAVPDAVLQQMVLGKVLAPVFAIVPGAVPSTVLTTVFATVLAQPLQQSLQRVQFNHN